MKRTAVVLALMCALVLAVGMSSAAAGLLPSPPPSGPPQGGPQQSASQDQDVKNETDQSNESLAVAVPILSGNNVALINGGNQTASADTTQNQGNSNGTDQTAVQAADQDQQAGAGKQDGYGKNDGGQSSSSASQRSDQDQDVKNETDQTNESVAVAAPIASGNNVALINFGDQNASADTTQNQGNVNGTDQTAVQVAGQEQQNGSGKQDGNWKTSDGQSSSGASQRSDQDQDVKNETTQENKSAAIAVPILSGNNVALINGGNQTASADTTQNQGNFNATEQKAIQVADQDQHGGSAPSKSTPGRYDGKGKSEQGSSGQSQRLNQDQDVKNETDQSNHSVAVAVPILSGNNVALINGDNQTASADTTQNQGNVNWTDQKAIQVADQDQHGGSSPSKSTPGRYDGKSQCSCKNEQHSAGQSQRLYQDQDVTNHTHQENKSAAVAIPILSGNNVGLINFGGQTASADTTQNQGNFNWTDQKAIQVADQDQHGGSSPSKGKPSRYDGNGQCSCKNEQHSAGQSQRLSQDQDVKNRTYQKNESLAVAVPILSGNNVALINGGNQTASADTTQNQGNFNWTDQKAIQVAKQDQHGASSPSKGKNGCGCDSKQHPKGQSRYDGKGKSECRCKKDEQHSNGQSQRLYQDQDVKNRTYQENKSAAFAVPILSGNNVGLINFGNQTASAETTQNQGNFNWTRQKAFQGGFQWQAAH